MCPDSFFGERLWKTADIVPFSIDCNEELQVLTNIYPLKPNLQNYRSRDFFAHNVHLFLFETHSHKERPWQREIFSCNFV